MKTGTGDPYAAYIHTRPAGAPDPTPARLFARRYLLPALEPVRGRPIVELGAGTGTTLRALRELGLADVQGCDGSRAQVELAAAAGVEVVHADGLAFLEARQPGSLGAVVALDVLEHLPEAALQGWMAAAHSRLQPGGVLLARVPNGAGLFAGAVRYGDLTHLRAFTTESLRQLLGLAGFAAPSFLACRPVSHGPLSAARLAAWLLVEAGLRFAAAAETGRWRGEIFTRNLLVSARKQA